MNEEWGTPISKEKIIDRRNKLIEYQKTQDMRFTAGYQIIDENILAINYMIYEIERLNNIIKESIKLTSKVNKMESARDLYDLVVDIENKLKEVKKSE